MKLAALALFAATHAPVQLQSPVQDKNFFLLSMIERTPAVRAAVKSDSVLSRIAAAHLAALDKAVAQCDLDLDCYAAAFRWSEEETAEAGRALGNVAGPLTGPLRASGMYVRYENSDLIERAWSDCARGMNHIIDVYGLGKPPRYPAIDSITYDAKSDAWRRVVQNLAATFEEDRASFDLFFSTSLRFALEVMFFNHRDEASRLEPMESGENASAFRRMKSVRWDQFPYSAIVVPGAGNDRPGVRLSAFGKLRDEIAAKRYRERKAPFVLVSGGYVHPAQTEFAEAVEMKRDLMARFGIPENAILIDPHARHTTTNLRNAARLMYRYGMPFDKKALVTSDMGQSKNIESAAFEKRCLDELGYMPLKVLGRVSPFDLEFLPLIESLQIDPMDPLDPF